MPVSVILDCLASGMAAEQITAEYPTVTAAGGRGCRLRGGLGVGRTASHPAVAVTGLGT